MVLILPHLIFCRVIKEQARASVVVLEVCLEVGLLDEAPVTEVAAEGLDTRVKLHVGGQVSPLRECFLADEAREGPLSGVRPHVGPQCVRRHRHVAAQPARIPLAATPSADPRDTYKWGPALGPRY